MRLAALLLGVSPVVHPCRAPAATSHQASSLSEAQCVPRLLNVQEHEEDDTDLAHRLTQIYDRMAEINAASAESRASKILHGLGFTEVMQVGCCWLGCRAGGAAVGWGAMPAGPLPVWRLDMCRGLCSTAGQLKLMFHG